MVIKLLWINFFLLGIHTYDNFWEIYQHTVEFIHDQLNDKTTKIPSKEFISGISLDQVISRKSLQNLSFFLPSQTLLLCFLSFSLILPLFLTINRNLNDAFKSLSTWKQMLNKTTLLSLNMECFLKPLSMRTVSVKTDDWHLWQITNLNVTIKLHSLWLLKTKIWRRDSIQKQGKVLMSVSPHQNWQQRKPALIVSHESEPTDTRPCQEI